MEPDHRVLRHSDRHAGVDPHPFLLHGERQLQPEHVPDPAAAVGCWTQYRLHGRHVPHRWVSHHTEIHVVRRDVAGHGAVHEPD